MTTATLDGLRASELATAVGGGCTATPSVVDGVAIDSRQVAGGELFVPIVAERDGHDFIPAALAAGAAVVLTQQRVPDGVTSIAVADTVAALLDVGRLARRRLGSLVVGHHRVGGQDLHQGPRRGRAGPALADRRRARGASTTSSACPSRSPTRPTAPRRRSSRWALAGVGTSRCCATSPGRRSGVVTAVVARPHRDVRHRSRRWPSPRASSSRRCPRPAPPSSTPTTLGSRPWRRAPRRGCCATRCVADGGADIVAEGLSLDDELRGRFTLRTPWGSADVAARGAGRAPGRQRARRGRRRAGLRRRHRRRWPTGLGDAVLSPWRMDLQRTASGAMVLNDSYNANPTSMAAALRSLAALPARRRIAVLGLMAELGDRPRRRTRGHRRAGRRPRRRRRRRSRPARYGLPTVSGLDGALATLGVLDDGDAVLVKGSRVAGLERLAAALLET